MNYFSIIFLIFFLVACGHADRDKLAIENARLKVEIEALRAELERVEHSFIIPYDSISQYMMPVTFGLPELKVGEKGEYATLIAWTKFPKGIDFEWQIINGNGIIKRDNPEEIINYVALSYDKAGEKEERGVYSLSFPNGLTKEFNWLKSTTVK